MPGIVWETPPTAAWPDLAANYVFAIEQGVEAIAKRWAPEIENWMKDNAPWEDRTSNARDGLYTEVNQVAGVMTEIILAHGVDYGLWLEVRWAGRWSIVTPALDQFGPRVWADVVRMLT